jgi:DNA invertase Pin-like site-specific DNA recombinase
MNAVMRPERLPQLKIRPGHLALAAIVYVRQSTRGQVLEHTESTRLQYALVERAVALGWARSQVIVIDDDLGVSAAVPDSRKGFSRLVTEVTMGRAGIVMGIEMSRLARTGKDWHHLLELCSLSGTLLADPDAVYDPGYYNDRLLLGLKGTMSEAEIFLIRQRMLSAKRAKAERGELILQLPIGYVRRPSGEAAFDPDEQAQHVVRLIFDGFSRLGTLNAVLRYLVQHEIQLPVRLRTGPAKGDLEWRRPTRETLQNMLRNPAYAGYYAFGRRQVDPRRKVPGRPDTGAWYGPRTSGWCCCRGAFRPTSPRKSTGRTWRGWRRTGRRRSPRERRGTGRRCCPGWCAAACAAGTAWPSATTTGPPAPPTATRARSTR